MHFEEISLLIAGGDLFLGLFLCITLLARGGRDAAPRWLGALLLACALNAAHPAVMGAWGVLSASGQLFEPIQFLIPPLLAAYAVAAQGTAIRLSVRSLLHLLPFAAAVAVSMATLSLGPLAPTASIVFWGCLTVQILGYLVPLLRQFHRYEASLTDRVSNLARFDLGWLRIVLGVASALSLLSLLVVAMLHAVAPPSLGPWVTAAMTAALWTLGYKGLEQRSPGQDPSADRPPLDTSTAKRLAGELLRLFEQAKPHLDPDLDLSTLAGRVSASRNDVSYVINKELGQSFYDLVNTWRVKEFCALAALPERDGDKLLTLAFDAGFNSKPTFNKVVLKLTGKTPSQVRQQEIESRRTR